MSLYVPVTRETEAGGSLEHRSIRSPGHCNNPILHPSRKHAAGYVRGYMSLYRSVSMDTGEWL